MHNLQHKFYIKTFYLILVPRDINERGRDLDYVLNQYMNFVKPAFEEFCLPTKKFADVIIPRGADNTGTIYFNNHFLLIAYTNRKINKNLLFSLLILV